jgi:hypothetical protein
MKKSIFSIIAASVALVGIANAGSVVFSNFNGTFTQIQADGVALPAGTGFVAVGTTALTPGDLAANVNGAGELTAVGLATLAADFTVFGASATFGFNGLDGYFEGNAQGNAGLSPFNGTPIILVAGNGTGIADSTSLLIIAGADAFGADNPVFSSNVGPEAGSVLFGALGGTNSLNAASPALQMGNVAGIIPEPGVSILALLSAGIIFLRRRR